MWYCKYCVEVASNIISTLLTLHNKDHSMRTKYHGSYKINKQVKYQDSICFYLSPFDCVNCHCMVSSHNDVVNARPFFSGMFYLLLHIQYLYRSLFKMTKQLDLIIFQFFIRFFVDITASAVFWCLVFSYLAWCLHAPSLTGITKLLPRYYLKLHCLHKWHTFQYYTFNECIYLVVLVKQKHPFVLSNRIISRRRFWFQEAATEESNLMLDQNNGCSACQTCSNAIPFWIYKKLPLKWFDFKLKIYICVENKERRLEEWIPYVFSLI